MESTMRVFFFRQNENNDTQNGGNLLNRIGKEEIFFNGNKEKAKVSIDH